MKKFRFCPSFLSMQDERLTEQRNSRSSRIDRMSPLEIVDLINEEDRTVASAVGRERESVARAVELAARSLLREGRLVYVGAGTSGRLGLLDAAEMPPTFGTPPHQIQGVMAGGFQAFVRAQEGAEDSRDEGAGAMDSLNIGEVDFVLGIATSGSTPFVHGALERARGLGAATGLLVCTTPRDSWLEAHDVVMAPLVGPEVIAGSTRMKAGTATKMILNTISTGAMVLLGKTYGDLMVDLQVTCQKLKDRGERILMETLGLERGPAATLLDGAGGSVKTAMVMGALKVGRDEAETRLAEEGGFVSRVVGDLP
jgi:N-acetylmuramic acid 6-phosphate etherase